MIQRLKYLLLTMLLLTAFHAAGQYSIDKICVGTERYYRVTGEISSTYTWNITDPGGVVIPQQSDKDTIAIIWNMAPGLYQLSVIQHSQDNCDANIQLGTVEIFAQPNAFAGTDIIQCTGNPIVLTDASAENYNGLIWTSSGDGTFNDRTILHPTYTPGNNDIASGNVVLTLSVSGLGNSGTCIPAVSNINISISTITAVANITPASCSGMPNGSVTLTATGGTEPYNFILNGISSTSGIYSNLAAGTYYYTISDAINCEITGEVIVGSEVALTAMLMPTHVNCFGFANGSISITGASGGSGNYEYSIDNTSWQGTPLFTGLVAGNYTVLMRDSDVPTCMVSLGSLEISEPAALYAESVHTNVSVPGANDGTIKVINQSGGSGNYEYSIDGINWQSSVVFDNLPPGTYTVSVRDASTTDCSSIIGDEIVLEGLMVTIVANNVSCFGLSDGQAIAIVSGGTLPYTYLWNDPSAQTTSTAINLASGIYAVIVTDSMGITATALDTITQPEEVIPAFASIGPLCQNSIPPVLPDISLNNITGTWTPSTINTIVIGTTIYTFTPDTGQCAIVVTLGIQVTNQIIPTFATIGPLCQNSTPPILLTTSQNGITGNWTPSSINTSVIGSTIYTFTPDTGQCAVVVTMGIQVVNEIIPTFASIGPLCQNSTPPLLPAMSINGITGSWNPSIINTLVLGTTFYTFTPSAGQCAAIVTIGIEVINQVIPMFAIIGPLCLNSTPQALPDTSLNNISGGWMPATISTSVAGITTYTFNPDTGQCAVAVIMEIEVTNEIIPQFESIGPLCQNSTPPLLPDTSLNNITGSWLPATISTSVAGITTYTFNPDTGQCAVAVIMEIEVTNEIVPQFESIGPLCQKSTPPLLPDTSLNNITGSWLPATISTSVAGLTSYTFKADTGQCAVVVTMEIEVFSEIVPAFATIGPLCENSVPPLLPDTSLNNITGKWAPANISTTVAGNTIYTFTPNEGQCAVTTSLAIEVSSPVIIEIKAFTSTNGLPNGHVKIVAGGDTSLLTYSLNGYDWQSSDIFTHLIAGTYTAWVKDTNGCMTSQPFIILNTLTGDVGVLAGDVMSCISVPFEIPVMAYDFTNISAFTIQLAFDSSVVTFDGLSQVNILLNEGNLSTSLISPGILQISFTASDSITLISEDLLFMLNFNGLSSGNTELQWNWLQCVIYSASGYEVPAIYTKGTVEIRPAPLVFTEGGGNYCEGTPLKLNSGSLTGQNLRYKWTGPEGATHIGPEWDLGTLDTTASGVYQVIASDSSACSKTEIVQVEVNANPDIKLSDYDTLCSEQAIVLNPGTGFAGYRWQDESKEPQLVATSEGLYWVIVTDYNGCQGGDSVVLRPCELLIWIPNAFSPNGDGLNDEFLAKYNLDVKITFQMLVFNKWGEQIFSSNDITKGWDGTFKGEPCPQDLYTWIISFKAPPTYNFLQISPQRGNVMLLK